MRGEFDERENIFFVLSNSMNAKTGMALTTHQMVDMSMLSISSHEWIYESFYKCVDDHTIILFTHIAGLVWIVFSIHLHAHLVNE